MLINKSKHPMDRIGVLIKRMLEQYENNAGNHNLMLTAQMLLNELQQMNNEQQASVKNIAVIMPSIKRVEIDEQIVDKTGSAPFINISQQGDVPEKEVVEEKIVHEESGIAAAFTKEKPSSVREPRATSQYNIEDIPTFAYQQKNAYELNEAMSQNAESLNDRLKIERNELGSVLKETPIRDLRKAIGINDRFVFINELFRGDENMYERSIKTINSFGALGEAEFWIQRELKTKIGWNEGNETVQHFDQLVRRRFA
jgi:hypothetical protein